MRMLRRWNSGAAGFATVLLAGCAALNRGSTEPFPYSWPMAVTTSRQLASESRFDAADSILADFAKRHPGTTDALEAGYWRALLELDPKNPHGASDSAMKSLDAYLADTRKRDHVVEAGVLRHLAGELERMNKLAASAQAEAKDATMIAANAKSQAADARALADAPSPADAEVKRLKEELAKANAELERIRKRLSQPGKP